MNFSKRYIRRLAVVCLAVSAVCGSSDLIAQEELEMIRQFPLQYLRLESVEMNLEQLQWQLDRLKMKEEVLLERIEISQRDQRDFERARSDMVESLPEEFRFVDDKARADAASRCLQELLSARLELATHNALLEELENSRPDSIDKKRHELARRQIEIQLRVKESEIALAKRQLDHTQRLVEQQMVQESDVQIAEVELERARADLESAMIKLQIHKEEAAAPANREMADIRRQIKALQAREEAARYFLKQLNDSADSRQRIRRLDEGLGIKLKMTERLNHQRLELQNEIDEIRILQRQVQNALDALPENQPKDDDH